MKRKRFRPMLWFVFGSLSFLIILAWFNLEVILKSAEALLIVDQVPERSDIVFVPSGNPAGRVPKAIELYRAGLAGRIVIAVEKPGKREIRFQERYGGQFSKRAIINHILEVESVDDNAVCILKEPSRSTRDDFLLLKPFLEEERIESVIVTSVG